MRKASSVMKKTLIPGGTTTAAKPSSPAPAPTTSTSNRLTDTQHDSNQHLSEESSSIHDSDKHRLAKKVPALPDTSDGDQSSQQESATDLGVDFPILPSTSTFTLGGRDDRGEKLKKKAKNFLDERQKTKSRAQSLWSYIGKQVKRCLHTSSVFIGISFRCDKHIGSGTILPRECRTDLPRRL